MGLVKPSMPLCHVVCALIVLEGQGADAACCGSDYVFTAGPAQSTLFTSLLYPILFEDSLSVGVPGVNRGRLFPFTDQLGVGVPAIVGGALIATITYINYTNERDVAPDQLSVGVPTITAGSLV